MELELRFSISNCPTLWISSNVRGFVTKLLMMKDSRHPKNKHFIQILSIIKVSIKLTNSRCNFDRFDSCDFDGLIFCRWNVRILRWTITRAYTAFWTRFPKPYGHFLFLLVLVFNIIIEKIWAVDFIMTAMHKITFRDWIFQPYADFGSRSGFWHLNE